METRLAAVMKEKGVKPRRLAHKLDLDTSYIYLLMRGKRRPSIQTGEAIARELDADFSDLFLSSNDTHSRKTSKEAV